MRFAIPKPPFAPASDPPASPGTATNFLAIADDGASAGVPPDTQGAVGPSNVVTMLNSLVRIQDRQGGTNLTTTLSNWWGFSATKPFDPRVVYDPYGARWIAVAAANKQASDAALLVGVSQSDDPTGAWHLRKLDADTNHTRWGDFPMVGFNKNWIVVTANMYATGSSAESAFHFVRLWVFNKTNLYAGGTNAPTILMAETNSPKAFTLAPSLVYDDLTTNMHLLTVLNTNALRVYELIGSLGSEQLVATTNCPAVATNMAWVRRYHETLGLLFQALTNGSHTRVFAADDRISAPVIQRNGFLWCAHHIFLPYGPAEDAERTAVQWWQISLRSFVPQPIGRIEKLSDDTAFAYSSIAVNRFNDVLIGYSRFSSIQWISGNYSFHDYCDTVSSLRSDTVLKAGEANFLRTDGPPSNRNRWGDYSATVVDPANDTDFWTLQEYARAPVNRWGTWWGKVSLPVPTNDSFANALAITNSSGTTNGTVIRATMETGEPLHGSGTNTPSVWFRWVAPASGDVTFDTAGGSSSFPLILSVYTGTNVSNLTLKTNASGSAPAVAFGASSGTTYQVAVAGLNVACVGFTLHWEQAAAPMFVQHPEGTNVVVGEDALFKSLAIPSPTYFWRFRGTNAADLTNLIAGANSATYTVTNVAGTNAGSYWVVASNATGFATSSVATLFVHGNSAARLSLLSYTSNSFYFHLYGLTNRAYRIETSTNLASPTNWYPIHTNYVSYWFTNYGLTNPNSRFFRAITNE